MRVGMGMTKVHCPAGVKMRLVKSDPLLCSHDKLGVNKKKMVEITASEGQR